MIFRQSSSLDYFFDIAPDIMCVLTSDLKVVKANKSILASLGYSQDELSGSDFVNLISPEDRQSVKEILERVNKELDTFSISSRSLSKDGQTKWFSWVFSTNGKNRGKIFAVAEDKTEEQTSRNQLILQNRKMFEDKARSDAMLENIGDGIVEISGKGEIQYVNKRTEELLGFKEDELKSKLFVHAIQSVDDKGNPTSVEKHPIRLALMTGKTAYSRDLSFVRKNKEPLAVAVTASPVVFQNVNLGAVIVFRDITKEKEIDRMKTEFISLASHQLRTPLSAMKWFSEMLLDGDMGELNSEQREVINNIYNSNERMIDLVNSLLNISRIESGRMIIEPEPTDLKKLVDTVILELQPKLQTKKHHLAVSTHGQLPLINIDPKLIRHVYMNLLTNSIKYTPDGGEIIVLISRSGNEIISQVTDNGYGIPKSQQDKVFQKFFRAQNIVKIETDGTGLGLYLLKAIVESSGGRIWFTSEERQGTTFWFSLPISGSQKKEGEVTIDS